MGDFEIVRVRIKKSMTAVLDSRCPHAGTPWTGGQKHRRLFRTHFYGFRKDVQARRDGPGTKDEFTTVDLCDSDYSPIVGWAQQGKDGPIFATR